jgi:AP-1 complex subunit gamma-1
VLAAAVPKIMSLTLERASGSSLARGGAAITQRMTVVNSQYGVKPLVMRIKLNYSAGDEAVADEVTVNDFPPGS